MQCLVVNFASLSLIFSKTAPEMRCDTYKIGARQLRNTAATPFRRLVFTTVYLRHCELLCPEGIVPVDSAQTRVNSGIQ